MTDLDVRQRLQTSAFGEARHIRAFITGREVAERLCDPALGMNNPNQVLISGGPWPIYPGVLTSPAMTASLCVAERTDVDIVLAVALKHPAYST